MACNDLCLMVFMSSCSHLSPWIDVLFSEASRILWKWQCGFLGQFLWHWAFYLALSWINYSGETSYYFGKILRPPYGEFHVARNQGLLTTASINLPVMWVSHFGSRLSISSQAFRWLQSLPTSWLQPHENP